MTKKTETKPLKCTLCAKTIEPHPVHGWAFGNNAAPLNDGRCCDNCNSRLVIPARLQRLFEQGRA